MHTGVPFFFNQNDVNLNAFPVSSARIFVAAVLILEAMGLFF